jgi:conjugal transfer mating pair stabilization protein TraG
MLVYGGSITATHFLGRMQSGDFVDEKLHAPSLLQGGALLSMQHRFQHGPTTGTLLQGAERVLPHFELGQELQAGVSSSAMAQQQTASQFLQSLGRQSSLSHGHQEDWHHQMGFSQQTRTQQSETDRFLQSQGQGLSERYAETGLSGDDFSSLLGGALSGSFGSGESGMRAGLSSTLQNRYHVSASKADEIGQDLSTRINEDHGFQTDLARTVQSDASHGHRNVSSLGLQEQDLNVLQHSAQELISASKSYQEQVGSTTRFSTGQSLGAAEIGLRILRQEESRTGLNQALDQLGLKGDAIRLGHEWESMGLMTDPRQSYAAAGISLLTGHAEPVIRTLDAHERHLGSAMGQVILGEAFKAPHPSDQMDPLDHQHLKDTASAIPGTQSAFEALEFETASGEIHARLDQDETFQQGINHSLNESSDRIQRDHSLHKGMLAEEMSVATDDLNVKRHLWALHQLESAVETPVSPAEKQFEWSEVFLTSPLENFRTRAGLTFDGFMETYRNAESEGMGHAASLMAALRALPDSSAQMIDAWIKDTVTQQGDGLTAHQKDYLSAVMEQNLKGKLLQGRYGEDAERVMSAREQIRTEDPEAAPWIMGLLERMGLSDRPQDLKILKRYNQSARASGLRESTD